MSNLTGVTELDIPILRYLDVDTIINILKTKNREITESILNVIRLYKHDDPEYLARLLNWTRKNKNDSFYEYLIELGADVHLAARMERCQEDGCNIKSIYGYLEENPTRCIRHKFCGMIDVVNKRMKRCQEDRCMIIPVYGNPGEIPKYCNKHRLPGMIDVMNKRRERC